MAVTLGTNINALQAQRRLGEATSAVSSVYERLATGQRINHASDDAAGLSIADSLAVSGRVYTKGIANLNDGISLLSVADGAVSSLEDVLIRLKELSVQASNGVLSYKQRKALDSEAQALIKEHDRIINTTSFNGIAIFGTNNAVINLQAGDSVVSTTLGARTTVGTGTFQPVKSYFPSGGLFNPVIGDFNNDGALDVAGINAGGVDGYLRVMLGNADGSFQAPVSYWAGSGAATYYTIQVADMNNDGRSDLLAGDGAAGFYLLAGNGDGTFRESTSAAGSVSLGGGLNHLDVNSDGDEDVVLSNGANASISIFLGNGNGTFRAALSQSFGFGVGNGVDSVADVNNDGRKDIVLTNGAVSITTLLNNGDGSFGFNTVFSVGANTKKALGDLNGDGNVDIVLAYQASNFASFLGNGDGTFRFGFTDAGLGGSSSPTLADLNGDGRLDLIREQGTVVSIDLGNGDGSFQAGIDVALGSTLAAFAPAAVGDYNGDGVSDILTGTSLAAGFAVLLGYGTTGTVALGQRLLYNKGIDLTSLYAARQSQTKITQQLSFMISARSTIGASESRLSAAVNVLQTQAITFRAAESNIRDADVATETSKLLSNQIRQQAAAAVLAHAKTQPEIAVNLLAF